MVWHAGPRRFALAVLLLALSWAGSAAAQESPLTGIIRVHEVAFVTLQALDLHSTHLALNDGARESNPLMRAPLAGQIAVKAGMTTGLLLLSERLRKKHPQLVMWTLTGLNCTYAAVVAHNYAVHASIHPGP